VRLYFSIFSQLYFCLSFRECANAWNQQPKDYGRKAKI